MFVSTAESRIYAPQPLTYKPPSLTIKCKYSIATTGITPVPIEHQNLSLILIFSLLKTF